MRFAGLICPFIALMFVVVGPASGVSDDESSPQKEVMKMPVLEIKSSSVKAGENIPAKFTCDGENISPQLSWSGIPDSVKELILICDDPDAPAGTWVHWVLYGLSPDTNGLPENVAQKEKASGATQGKNDFGKIGYGGPCPPRGKAHRYFFRLYAIDKTLNLKPGAIKKDVMKAIDGHIMAQGELMGKYGR